MKASRTENKKLIPGLNTGTKQNEDVLAPLSSLIKLLNERFGTKFGENERYFFLSLINAFLADEDLSYQARNNTLENFKYGFTDRFYPIVIELHEKSMEMDKRLLGDEDFATSVSKILDDIVYTRLKAEIEDEPDRK